MMVEELAAFIRALDADELKRLRELLRDLLEPPTAGVREPRRPIRPLDARGVAVDVTDPEVGKVDYL